MKKSNSTQKQVMGKPQVKRPKLDFTSKSPFSHPVNFNNTEDIRRNCCNADFEDQKAENVATTSDWDDDDFSGDMLEKVCLIADLSQAMVNNESRVIEEIDDETSRHGHKRTAAERDVLQTSSKLFEELDKLRVENDKLMESIKTKEGEVQILRSQLKQTQEAKQADTLKNIKIMEEMQNTYREKIETTQREYNTVKTELQFKELELKSLNERCKQLESSTSKVKLIEPQGVQLDSRKSLCNSSQAPGKGRVDAEMEDVSTFRKEEPVNFEVPICLPNEGQKFGSLVCPEFFEITEESNVISFYKFHRGCGFHVSSLDFDKREKYKWSGLPKQSVFLSETYNYVSSLLLYENFNEQAAKGVIENLLNVSMEILKFDRDLLLFLEQLQEKNSQFDDSDYLLLESEEEVQVVTVKRLLSGNRLNGEECGIESRRVLGMIVSLILSSKLVLLLLIERTNFLILLKDIATSIGNVRKPTRYSGILAGITLIITEFLREKELQTPFLTILNEIMEEIIFARPKLDVLTLIVEAVTMSRNHVNFIQALCRKGSVESYALYMDSKLHQAMFFTKDACPLKLLCTQIMGLACIPVNREMRWNVTRCVIKWLNEMMHIPSAQEIKWLPGAALSDGEDKCFDILECFVYLLSSCLKDYLFLFDAPEEFGETSVKTVERLNNEMTLLSIVGDGSVLLQRFLKLDQRLLHESYHNLRFANLLKSLTNYNCLNYHQKEAVAWIIELLESDLKNPEGCAKVCALNDCEKSIMDSLKINDNLIIF